MAIVLFAIIEVGRAMWTREALQQTAAAGARCMGVLNSNCAAGGAYSAARTTSYVESVASGWGVTLTDSAVGLNRNATCGGVSGFSSVTLSYTFQTVAAGLIQPLGAVPMQVMECFPNNS
jgi:Flp pilus assembly protein TadG